MRILQIVQRPQRRGAELFAFDLSGRLESLGEEVRTLYLYGFEGERRLTLRDTDSSLEGVDDHPFERFPGFHPAMLGRVVREIREFDPDIVQVNGSRTVKYGAAAKAVSRSNGRWKLVYRNIGIPSDWHSSATAWVYRKAIMPRMDGVVGVSRFSLEDAEALYRFRVPSTVIPNGISPARLNVVEGRDALRDRYRSSPDDLILLFVGYMEEAKRPDRFVRVLSRVARKIPRVRGWIVGDGPLRGKAEGLSRDLGIRDKVRFLGYQEDVASFMNAADLLVVTSDTEGIPGAVLEAGYLGLPVVSTKVGGLPECIVQGETGVLVDGDPEEGLTRAIVRLGSDEESRREIGGRARARIVDELTIGPIADRYLAFYRRLLKRPVACPAYST